MSRSKEMHDFANRPQILITNPNATRSIPFDRFPRGMYSDEFKTPSPDFEENVAALLEYIESLKESSILAINSGDGVVSAVDSALLQLESDSDHIVAPLRRGNFNDSRGPKTLSSLISPIEITDIHPLDLRVHDTDDNEILHRNPLLYASIGLLALIAQSFGEEKSRETMLQHPITRLPRSLAQAGKLWLEHKSDALPPSFWLDDPERMIDATDIIFANNPTVARLARLKNYLADPTDFGRGELDLSRVLATLVLGARAVLDVLPTEAVESATLQFANPVNLLVHHDGETKLVESASRVVVAKSEKSIPFITA